MFRTGSRACCSPVRVGGLQSARRSRLAVLSFSAPPGKHIYCRTTSVTRPSTAGAGDFHSDLDWESGPKMTERGPSRRPTSLAAATATFENVGAVRASLPPPKRAYIPARGYGGVGGFPRSRAPARFYILTTSRPAWGSAPGRAVIFQSRI